MRIADKKSYVYGLLRRLILQGCLHNEEFKTIYNPKKYSKWAYLRAKPHVQSVLAYNYPKLISLIENPSGSFVRPASMKGNSWFKKWAEKHGINLPADSEMLNSMLFTEVLKLNAGLIQIDKDNQSVFALDPKDFFISRDHAVLKRCEVCAYLAAQDSIFSELNTSCFQMRCNGHLQSEVDPDSLAAESRYRLYMKSHYEKDMISPLAHPHTGQLKGEDRRQVEEAFKKGLLPGDKFSEGSRKVYKDQPINVLTCTPTMEMGIDIGTLSGVGLKSFPPTQASAVQRIGRSGRSSGNAYNIILLKDRPHDLTYWEDPNLYFKGSVRTPGCEFRNTQLLLRQFNAFLLDTFAKDHPELKIPKVDQDEKVDLMKTIYWSSLLKFVRSSNMDLIKEFVKVVLYPENSGQIKPNELELFLDKRWKSKTFADQLELVLSDLSRDLKPPIVKAEDVESDEPENIASAVQAGTRSFYRKQDLSEDTYVLKILADKGLLPNYAFPDKGVTLQYDLHLKTNSQNQKEQNKWISKSIERPPKSGLSDLALGQYYYADGFKVQISRAEMPTDREVPKYILCDECGSLTRVGDLKTTQVHDCPACSAADQHVIENLDYKYVYASDRFENSMISDNDDERVKKPIVIETFFEKSAENGIHFTWTSSEARIGFDFSVDQKIFHVNRNQQFGQTPMYFKVCPDCLAVPYSVDKDSNKQIFKTDHQFNRHGHSCRHRTTPNEMTEVDLKPLTLSRSLTSDVIRVIADNLESVPTLRAALRFAMKVYLKGEAQHLSVESSTLNNPDQSQIHLVTLYDNVPGGTGNLRSLMQLSTGDKSQPHEGFKKLKSIFSDSLLKLSNCECTNGCYNCLLSFENQFEHKKIFKAKAIAWFKRFNESNDWVVEENLINVKVGSDFRFGSPMEDKFIELLRSQNKISFIDRVNEVTQDGEQVFQLIGPEIKHQAVIVPRAEIRIPIQGPIPYTKPDFVLYAKNQIAAYIYVDGTEYHLNPDRDKCTFETTDIFTRPALQDRLNGESNSEIKKVLTLTSDMIQEIGKLGHGNQNTSSGLHNIFETLVQLFYNDTEPDFNEAAVKKSITLFANQSIKELVLQQSIYWTQKDTADFAGFLRSYSSRFKKQRFGGLRFDHKDNKFKMSVGKKYRAPNQQLKEHYTQSWNLYWVLNYIDSEIVDIED